MSRKVSYTHVSQKEYHPEWNAFVLENGPESGAFLQSWEWGNVLKSEGRRAFRIARGLDNKTRRVQCLYEYKPLLKSIYSIYIPRGPVGTIPSIEADLIKRIVEQEGYSRIAPTFIRAELSREIEFPKSVPVRDIQPSTTFITDVDRDEKELLSRMHHKTRYNIRLAKKKDVSVSLDGDLTEFMELISSTAKRHKVTFGSRDHYAAILEHLNGEGDAPKAFLAKAVHSEDVLAMALCIDFGKTRTYLHGASSDVKKNFMAPFLLHWELMKDAKAHGMNAYDWWGVAPEGVEGHRLAGVTRFKKGFGGRVVSYPETRDIIMRPMIYKLYRFAKKFR